jgi:hypothetical protein
MPDISTLVADIYHTRRTGEGWTKEISDWYSWALSEKMNEQMRQASEERPNRLRFSNIGQEDCKLWYTINRPEMMRPMPDPMLNVMSMGDMVEVYLLALTMAAGHSVTSFQAVSEINGIKGSNDAIIDGMMIDVKSASDMNYNKFTSLDLTDSDNDPDKVGHLISYVPQLAAYTFSNWGNPDLTYKTTAGFLVFNKQTGQIYLDVYDLSSEIEGIEEKISSKIKMVDGTFPGRAYGPVKSGEAGNTELSKTCHFCSFKDDCWPQKRTFQYKRGNGFVYKSLIDVVKVPRVPEVIDGKVVSAFSGDVSEDKELK